MDELVFVHRHTYYFSCFYCKYIGFVRISWKSPAAALTASVAVLSAITTFLNPADRSSQHKKAKDRFIAINIEARKLAIECSSTDSDEILQQVKEKLDGFSTSMIEALQASPQVPEWVFRIAEKRAERKFIF